MYNTLLIVQVVAVLALLFCIIVLNFQKNSTITKFFLITCICSLVQNAGYLKEMTSHSVSEAMVAVCMEYLGACFAGTLLMIFVFRYCHVYLMRAIELGLLTFDVIVLASVFLYQYVPFYYSSILFSREGTFPHLVLGKGILYIAFTVVFIVQILASIVVVLMSIMRTEDDNMRKNYVFLLLGCTTPLIFYILGIAKVFPDYDMAPIGGAIGILIFAFSIIFNHAFDIVETAREDILNNLEDAFVILDSRMGYQGANNAARKIFPEISKTPFGEKVDCEPLLEVFKGEEKDSVITLNGRSYSCHVNEVFGDAAHKNHIGYTLLCFDTTENRNQLERMNELRKQADSANVAKTAFLNNISREIRGPINVVSGVSDLIKRDYEDATLIGYANNIKEVSDTLEKLIDDIMDYSKIESGRADLNVKEYATARFFADIIDAFEHKGDDRNLKFTTNISPNIPCSLKGDEMRIRQIISNLLMNAFKYTRQGGVIFRAAFEWTDERHGNLIISVEDSGIGIRKETLDEIFGTTDSTDINSHRASNGIMLGLNICKQLVKLMGGEIKAYSEYGSGSVFTTVIPHEVTCSPQDIMGEIKRKVVEQPKEKTKLDFSAPSASILIVDDNRTNLIVAKALLRDSKASITTCTSGEDCIEKVQENHYDLIFLDHRMPGMDGVETLHKMMTIQHKCIGSPVVMLTANAVSDAREFYINEGFSDFLPKPITEESITSILKNNLPKHFINFNEAQG